MNSQLSLNSCNSRHYYYNILSLGGVEQMATPFRSRHDICTGYCYNYSFIPYFSQANSKLGSTKLYWNRAIYYFSHPLQHWLTGSFYLC